MRYLILLLLAVSLSFGSTLEYRLNQSNVLQQEVLYKVGYSTNVKSTRGLRNNNAGNLRLTNDSWKGLRDNQTDDMFFQFKTPNHGIRALAKVLLNYGSRHELYTVRGIINRYAPRFENDTDNYVAVVALTLGVNENDCIIIRRYLKPLVLAIIKYENGIQPYSMDLIDKSIGLY